MWFQSRRQGKLGVIREEEEGMGNMEDQGNLDGVM